MTRIIVIDDVLYVCNAGSDAIAQNTILAAPLTADASALLDEQVKALNGGEVADETSGESETETTPDTATPESDASTETVADTTSASDTTDTAFVTGIDIDEKKGCGSVVSAGAVVLIAIGGALALARKKND